MTIAATTPGSPPDTAAVAPQKRVRDPRLDFYRGIAMFIILLAHTPGNYWTLWIPARWGFSDATEMFVFCSGMASAIAFGSTFVRKGWWLGTARVIFRCWQVYWAHIGMFMVIASMTYFVTYMDWGTRNYFGQLNLWKVFNDPGPNLVGLMTLTYVPNYFDILPMYLVILAMMPFFILLANVNFAAAAGVSIVMWILAQEALMTWVGVPHLSLQLPAELWARASDPEEVHPERFRHWFFNPFGWQLVFFTGFSFMRGWIPAPPVKAWLIGLSLFIVLLNIPLSNIGTRELDLDWARDWRRDWRPWFGKSDFGILRYVQFLALAYLGYVVAGEGGRRLRPTATHMVARAWRLIIALITKVGQQSLAIFLFSMVFARVLGFVFDILGRNGGVVTIGNFIAFAILIAVAYGVAWFKSQPWRGGAS